MSGPDSISLDNLATDLKKKTTNSPYGIKLVVSLFLIFLLVVSGVFVGSVVGLFGNATNGREVTQFGTVLQGVFLVLFYIAAVYLIDQGIL